VYKRNLTSVSLVVNAMTGLELYVKGKKIVMNEFASTIVQAVFLAVLSNLKDVNLNRISKIEVS
jgi:hypothetical protein